MCACDDILGQNDSVHETNRTNFLVFQAQPLLRLVGFDIGITRTDFMNFPKLLALCRLKQDKRHVL